MAISPTYRLSPQSSVQIDHPLTLRQFSFAVDGSLTLPEHLPLDRLPDDVRRPKVLVGRLRSRCCGLVEIAADLDYENKKDVRPSSIVTFLHQTVSELFARR